MPLLAKKWFILIIKLRTWKIIFTLCHFKTSSYSFCCKENLKVAKNLPNSPSDLSQEICYLHKNLVISMTLIMSAAKNIFKCLFISFLPVYSCSYSLWFFRGRGEIIYLTNYSYRQCTPSICWWLAKALKHEIWFCYWFNV